MISDLAEDRVRFGALPKSVATRVRDADSAQLKRWLVRFAPASTLGDVLAEP